jgi:uncharacterized protein YndB with AHSA1/START domain
MEKSRELTIIREFDVPRELIWKAWTHPDLFKKWWGPKDFSCPYSEMDLRVGGKYLHCMQSPEGQDFWTTGVYKEIKPMEKLVFTDSFADEEGNMVSASYYGIEDFPPESEISVTLEKVNGKTKLTLRHSDIPEGDLQEETHAGWNQSFDKLSKSLKRRTQWS